MNMKSLLGMACLLLAGCAAQAENERTARAPLEVTFHVEDAAGEHGQAFTTGHALRFVFTVTNTTNVPQRLDYTFPPHRVSVRDEQGRVLWQAHQDRMFVQVMRNVTLAAGESTRFDVAWNAEVPAGAYDVVPQFHAFAGDQRLPASLSDVRIVIEGAP